MAIFSIFLLLFRLFGDTMISTVIFDIDNTLYHYDSAHQAAFQALCAFAQRELQLTPAAFTDLHRQADQILRQRTGGNCAAIHNRLIRYQILLEQTGRPISFAPQMSNLYWHTLLEHATAFPGAQDCFARLKANGYTIGIGTDMTADWQFAKLDRLGLLSYVDFMVSSEEAGAEKPTPRFFGCCLEKAGRPAEECAFVGDSLRKDAGGAQAAGMHPIWFCPDAQTASSDPSVTVLYALGDLPDLLLTLSP